MQSRVEMSDVGLSGEVCASMRRCSFHAMGSEVVKFIPIEACRASDAKRHRSLQRLCHHSRFARPCMHLQL